MKKELFESICKKINQHSSIAFSFCVVTKGIEFSYNLKNICDDDSEFISNGIESWFYNLLGEICEKYNAVFDRGNLEFELKDDILLLNGEFEVDDQSIYQEPDHLVEEVLTDNLKEIISRNLKTHKDQVKNDLINFHLDFDTNKGIEGFNEFKIFYDFNDMEEIELNLDEDLTVSAKEEIFNSISKWTGPYDSDLGDVITNIYCELEGSFKCTDIISLSLEITND